MADLVRVGLIGAGAFVDDFYLPALAGREDFVVTAVCAPAQESAAAAARRLGGTARVYTDYTEMLAQEALDAAIIAAADGEHYPIAMAALGAGLHLLCDKPLAASRRRAAELYRAAVAAGKVHMVSFELRLAPGVDGMRQLIQSGQLGPVYHAEAIWAADYAVFDAQPWKYTRAHGGSGAMADLGVQPLDLLRWMLGEVTDVCAHSAIAIPEHDLGDGDPALTENWDLSQALLRFASGVPAVVRASRVETAGWTAELRISCAYGGLTLRLEEGHWNLWLKQPNYAPRLLEHQPVRARLTDAGIAQINMFHQAILEGGPAEEDRDRFPTFRDGERVQAIIDAIDESSRKGGWVPVPAETAD